MQLMPFFTNRGTQLVCLGLKTRDATDTLEAVTLGRKWYNFLTAGRNSYLPIRCARVSQRENLLPLPGFVQPIAGRYADYAVSAPIDFKRVGISFTVYLQDSATRPCPDPTELDRRLDFLFILKSVLKLCTAGISLPSGLLLSVPM